MAKRGYTKLLLLGLVVLAVMTYCGTRFMTGGRPYSSNIDELRAQFNKDRGKVRLLVLLSPS